MKFSKIMENMVKQPGKELAGLAVAINSGNEVIYSGAWGQRRHRAGKHYPMKSDTICRVASMSKIITALTAIEMSIRGELDLTGDISSYLNFELRNPHFPTTPISLIELLSHRSSLRDGTEYNLPKEREIAGILVGDGGIPNWSSYHKPGDFFSYCNLGYGVAATVMERVSGIRFDRLVNQMVLNPLHTAAGANRISASFNVGDFTASDVDNSAEIYTKDNPDGPWIVRKDKYSDLERDRSNSDLYKDYRIGSNGTLFAPQGGMRASVEAISLINRLFLGEGTINGKSVVSPQSVRLMTTDLWEFNPEEIPEPGEDEQEWGYSKACGPGLFHIINHRDKFGSDELYPGGGPECHGHFGDAYGFRGATFFDRKRRLGFTYLITGSSLEPSRRKGSDSVFSEMEQFVMNNIIGSFWPDDFRSK